MSVTANNLDLTDVAPNDLEGQASRINEFYRQDNTSKAQLSYDWERNQLMLDGKQWIVYEGDTATGGMWKRLRVSEDNKYIPRPVTNYMFDAYQTLKSYLIKDKPRCKVSPNTQDFRDKEAAKLGTLICDVNWTRLKEQYNYEVAAANIVTYGTVFKKSYWDTSSLNLVKVPKMRQVPVTDPMTGQVIGIDEQPAVDPVTHEPLYDMLPIGDVNTYVIEPFRMCLDPLAMNLHDARWIMEYSIQPLTWIKETYGKEGDGYTGLVNEVEPDTDLNGTLRRWFQLRTSSGAKNANGVGASATGASDTMIDNAAVVKDYYEAPSAMFPKGRLIVVAGDKTVYSGESPYEGPEIGDWHPYSECRWEIVPGRFWAKAPLDAICEIQKRINSIDAIVALTRKTSAIPQKLIPIGVGISPGQWTGRPNQEIFYRNDGTGAKPEIIPPSGVHESVFQERGQAVSDLKEISGAIDILRGDRPAGVNAASALSMLYEVGTGKLFPILDRWKAFVENDQKKQLRLTSKFYKEPRPEFIRMLKAKNSDLSEQSINNFIGSDLYDNCNVVIEAGSNIPKLQSAKQAMLIQQAQMGVLNLENPLNRAQYLADMGVTGYSSDTDPDTKRAEWENDLLDNIQFNPMNKPVVLACDNHELHQEILRNAMKKPKWLSQSPEVQQAYLQHDQEHQMYIDQARMAQIYEQQAMGGGAIQPPAPVNAPAGAEAGKGPGLNKDIKNAINGADVVNPATLGNGR